MKRIVILCGCLEPGKDGVGDYSRHFAALLSNQGYIVGLVAIRDFYIGKPIQLDEAVATLRLPHRAGWHSNTRAARQFIRAFAPDLIFLQFVAYAFHPKGLPFKALWHLHSLLQETPAPLLIMFHEIWIGRCAGASLRHKLVGRLQRQLIRTMTAWLQPRQVFTSNRFFQQQLKTQHIKSSLLPVFSNIAYQKAAACPTALQQPEEVFRLGLLGNIHSPNRLDELISSLITISRSAQKRCIIYHIGQAADKQAALLRDKCQASPALAFRQLGFMPPAEVSAVFQHCDFGIALSPPETLDKSGAFACYVEHGLPVIVAGLAEDNRHVYPPHPYPNMLFLDKHFEHNFLHAGKIQPADTRTRLVASWLQHIKTLAL